MLKVLPAIYWRCFESNGLTACCAGWYDVGGGPLLFRIFHLSLMFYCSTKVWFVPCGPQFPWRLSEINGIALCWLYIKVSIFHMVNILDTYPLLLSVRLTPSDRLHIIPFQLFKMEPKLNKPSETLNKYWDQLRDESWCAKLSHWHDFQGRVWAKYFPPLHRSLGLAPVSPPSLEHFLEALPRDQFICIYLSYQNRWS